MKVAVYLSLILFVAPGLIAAESITPAKSLFTAPVPTPTPPATTKFDSYKGITIGSPAAKVAEALGTPTQKSKGGDYYQVSNNESAQFGYESNAVKSISVTYSGDIKSAPSAKTVLGSDVKKDSDGGINKMVEFPKDGYSLTYIRTGGSDAIVVVTLQKIPKE